jgi:peptidoglycan/LPS O-acetylase OafA/YrhL
MGEAKHKYEVLDGLRGVAALCVVMFHIGELVTPDTAHNPFRHTHLAVDFFFVLSGFVIAHAYGERLALPQSDAGHLSFRDFIVRRLIRLHPMVIASAVIALISYLVDPFTDPRTPNASAGLLTVAFVLSLCVLPQPSLPNRFGDIFNLNGPAWSLFQEYIGSFVYGLIGYRLPVWALSVFVALSGAGLAATSLHFNSLSEGWDWPNFWVAFVRLAYPFAAGLLLYRLRWRLKIPGGTVLLPLVLIAVFMAPPLKAFDGVFEASVVILLWPLVVITGAGVLSLKGRVEGLYTWLGRISYPLYIIHYPFMFVFAHWKWGHNPPPMVSLAVEVTLYVGLVGFAWLWLKFYDEPVRAMLGRWWQPKASKSPATGKA